MGSALDDLQFPADLDRLLESEEFWTPEACLEVFKKADEVGFSDPLMGLEVARRAVRLVDQLPGQYARGSSKTLLKSRAFTILGSRLRAVAKLDASDQAFVLACGLSWGAPRLDIADLLKRRALLRVNQRRFDSALMLMGQSLRILESEGGDDHEVGCLLQSRGHIYFQAEKYRDAVRDYSAATKLIDPDRRFIAYYGAVHNLAAALVKSAAREEELQAAIVQIQKAKGIGFGLETVPGLTLIWLEGLLLVKLGEFEKAEAAYRDAWAGLAKLGASYEVALLLLDLAELLCRQGRLAELVTVAAEMFPLFGAFRANREVIAGLRMFHHAALRHEITAEIIAKVRRIVERAARTLE